MIDSFNRTLQLLLPVRFVLASSDTVNKQLNSKYKCSLGNVFQLFPNITDITGSIRDPSTTTAYHLSSLNLSIHPLSCLAQEKLVTTSIKDQTGSNNNSTNREQNLFSAVSKITVKDVTNLDNNNSEIPSTPWFTEWKHQFLRTLSSCDHEYVDAFIGVIYVILIDEISSYKQIIVQLNETLSSLNLKWFSSSFLRYFILLNLNSSVSASDVASNEHYRELISQYGSVNCFWYDILDENDIVVAYDETSTTTVVDPSSSSINLPSNSIHPPQGNGNVSVRNLNFNTSSILTDPLTSPESPEAVDFAMINTFKNVNSDKSFSNVDSLSIGNSPMPPQSQSHQLSSSNFVVTKPVVSQGILILTERCLRNLIESSLIPWSEKIMRLLYDAISARKGIRKSLKVFLGMAPGSSVVRGPTSFIYKIDSDEMQARKLADLAFALGLNELAYKFYHSARDEFKADGACVYYAGAAEMTGITAFLTKKHNFKHYFEQSLSTYLDTCRNRELAARCVILATECIRAISSNDAANYFIRLTCEESDLMSALFLEQAAVCFMESVLPRKRKSAFHFVLAGHRYNKCGLRKHALSCYSRFSSSSWSSACEHVNITIARLLISLVDRNELTDSTSETVWHKGLDLLRKNTDKEIFFDDFVKEVKKRGLLGSRFTLNVPHIVSLRMDTIEGSSVYHSGQVTCFINEPVTFHITLYSPFSITIKQFILYTNVKSCETNVISSLDLDGAIEQTVTLTLVPRETGPLDILGIQFITHQSEIKATVLLDEKRAKKNRLLVIETLPLIKMDIQIGSYDVNVDAIEMLTGEYMPCKVTLLLCPTSNQFNSDWRPLSLKLLTNAQLLDVNSRQVIPVSLESPMSGIDLQFGPDGNLFYLQAPFGHQSLTVTFRIEYRDSRHSRTVTRRIEIYCRECIAIEGMIEGVVSLRNTLSAKAIQLTTDLNEDPLDLHPGLTAHVLVEENQLIPWRCSSRQGFLSLNNTQATSLATGF